MKIKVDELVKHVSDTGDFISINQEKCTLCERCLVICVMNLWKKTDNTVYIVDDYQEKCVECAACYQVCEAGAITFRYPAGGTGIVYMKG